MRNQLDTAEKEVNALQGGRKSSSAKARANLMSLKKGSHELRKSITTHTKSLPVKTRVKKQKEEEKVEEPDVVEETVVEKHHPKPRMKPKPKAPRATKKIVID